jgi:hypothetical protein
MRAVCAIPKLTVWVTAIDGNDRPSQRLAALRRATNLAMFARDRSVV